METQQGWTKDAAIPQETQKQENQRWLKMAKELNETTVSMEIVYDGVKTTLTRVIPNVGIEDGVAAMKKQWN